MADPLTDAERAALVATLPEVLREFVQLWSGRADADSPVGQQVDAILDLARRLAERRALQAERDHFQDLLNDATDEVTRLRDERGAILDDYARRLETERRRSIMLMEQLAKGAALAPPPPIYLNAAKAQLPAKAQLRRVAEAVLSRCEAEAMASAVVEDAVLRIQDIDLDAILADVERSAAQPDDA